MKFTTTIITLTFIIIQVLAVRSFSPDSRYNQNQQQVLAANPSSAPSTHSKDDQESRKPKRIHYSTPTVLYTDDYSTKNKAAVTVTITKTVTMISPCPTFFALKDFPKAIITTILPETTVLARR